MQNFRPKDWIALVLLIGVLILNWRGIELMIPQALLLILGYYFAKRADRKDTGY